METLMTFDGPWGRSFQVQLDFWVNCAEIIDKIKLFFGWATLNWGYSMVEGVRSLKIRLLL